MSKSYFFLGKMDDPGQVQGTDKREVYWPKSLGTSDYHDPSLRETFSSKRKMRAFMREHHLRDAGERLNPEKHIQGRPKSKPNPLAPVIREYIRSQGGTEGLLKKLRERGR